MRSATLCTEHPFPAQTSTATTNLAHRIPFSCTNFRTRRPVSTERLPPPLSGRSIEEHQSVPAIRLPRLYCLEYLKTRVSVDNSTKLLNLPHIPPLRVRVAKGNVADELQELVPKFYFIRSSTLCSCLSFLIIDSTWPGVK